jgi:DNA-binding SARP family transcriptional activator
VLRLPDGARTLAALALFDPDGWRTQLVVALKHAKGNDRSILLEAVTRVANRDTLESLSTVAGADVVAVRKQLRFLQAPRLFLRTLGGVAIHRGSWDGPLISIEKKRVRMLVAVLAAHHGSILSRDVALDILWPDSDPNSAVNSLNQTVFQLRRYIDTSYRGGESPEYVTSTSEQVGLNPDLVHTDLGEIRRLPSRLATADWHDRQAVASRAVKLVRGEFLADLRYEDWANRQQLHVHAEIRENLLPIALAPITSFDVDVSAQAAAALLNLDPFDEAAILALADCLSQSGRRAAARQVVIDFLRRMQSDLDLDPSADFQAATTQYGLSISH